MSFQLISRGTLVERRVGRGELEEVSACRLFWEPWVFINLTGSLVVGGSIFWGTATASAGKRFPSVERASGGRVSGQQQLLISPGEAKAGSHGTRQGVVPGEGDPITVLQRAGDHEAEWRDRQIRVTDRAVPGGAQGLIQESTLTLLLALICPPFNTPSPSLPPFS